MSFKNVFLRQCKISYEKYKARVPNTAPANGGILDSEALALVSFCDLYDIDVLIESGIFFGRSTEILCNYFIEQSLEIHSMDLRIMGEVSERLSVFKNLTLHECDSTEKIPELISLFADKKVGLFIDGPKGNLQLDLAKKYIDDVEFVALHDVGKEYTENTLENINKDTHQEFIAWDKSRFITTESWYSDEYSYLNEDQINWLRGRDVDKWPKRDDSYNSSAWNPVLDKIFPFGFGLGVAVKDEE